MTTAEQRPRLLDLFCGAGGAGMGYERAGFDVTGVDWEPQPRYPFEFRRNDALTIPLDGYDAYHASPPCQAHIRGLRRVNETLGRAWDYPDAIERIRARLVATGKPYVIENVEGAPLINPARLCGSSFGLPLRRHRLFESNVLLMAPPCDHGWQKVKRYWTSWVKNGARQRAAVVQVYGNGGERHEWPAAMGIHWMAPHEMTQAIPPAYTEHIGRQLLTAVSASEPVPPPGR